MANEVLQPLPPTMTSANRRRSTRSRPIRWSACAAEDIRRFGTPAARADAEQSRPWRPEQYLAFLAELGRIATGGCELAPDAKDKRFADPAWKESVAYRALAQGYLAWGGALNRFVDEAKMDKRDAERARFVVSLVVDAMSPTNSLAGNPAALKKLVDTGGASLVHGLENFVGDLVRNGGLPAQVDTRKFAVGKNLRDDAGRGRLSQPGDGADPVPADGRRGAQAAAAHRPAADQQVLCLRPCAREEHRSVSPRRATCRPSPSAGRTRPPPKATSGSTPMSRRWRKRWM